jgi:hypothetical protein
MRLTREEAEHYYEEDEDPSKVFEIFDGAEREGRLGNTGYGYWMQIHWRVRERTDADS